MSIRTMIALALSLVVIVINLHKYQSEHVKPSVMVEVNDEMAMSHKSEKLRFRDYWNEKGLVFYFLNIFILFNRTENKVKINRDDSTNVGFIFEDQKVDFLSAILSLSAFGVEFIGELARHVQLLAMSCGKCVPS